MQGVEVSRCVFGCDRGVDRLEHYAVCSRVWFFFQKPRPHGLGIATGLRSLDGFLMSLRGIGMQDKLAMAE